MNYVVGGGQLFFTEQKNKDNFFFPMDCLKYLNHVVCNENYLHANYKLLEVTVVFL